MASLMNTFYTIAKAVVELIIAIFNILFPPPKEPDIESFSPQKGWPGTILILKGKRFSQERDGNLVKIGGDRALILEAAENELQVLAGEKTVTGTITVQTAEGTGTSASNFQVLPYPDIQDISQAGPPVFFHGPQPGTPKLGETDQKVLVIFCYADDQSPVPPHEENIITAAFHEANRYWREASYGSTSWDFKFTPWLKLDNKRDDYAWQREDIDAPLVPYLEASKHGLGYRQGTVYAGFDLNFLSEVKAFNIPAKLNEMADLNLSGEATAVHITGNRAYVAAGKAGLYIFNIDAGPAEKLKRITSPYWLCGVDSAANRLVVAAREGGALIFDKSISTNPQLLHTLKPVNAANYIEWVTAVKMAGGDLLVGIYGYDNGPYYRLRLYDLSNPTLPGIMDEKITGGLIREIDIDSSGTCVVATDGNGLEIFDVGSGKIVRLVKDPVAVMPYALSVALENNMAYVAGANSGFQIIDLTDPKHPKIRGQLSTSKAACQVTVDNDRAYLLLGARQLMVVDVSNPDNPQPLADTTLGSQTSSPGGKDPDLAALRTKVHIAIDMHALVHHFDTFLAHAIKKARSHYLAKDQIDILSPKEKFVGFIALLAGPFLRGQSFVMDTLTNQGWSYKLNGKKGLIYLAQTGSDWSRVAHEIGHWFGMEDIYDEKFADGTYNQGTAAPWCMSGDGWELFCGFQIHEKMGFYSVTPQVDKYQGIENLTKKGNVLECEWSPTAPTLDKTFTVVAHGKDENTNPDRFHLIKIIASEGLVYYVEVRQRQDGSKLIFDKFGKVSNLPCAQYADPVPFPNVGDSAVVVTRATAKENIINNSSERLVMHLGKKWYPPTGGTILPECDEPIPDRLPLDVGDKVVDAARRLEIEVVKINTGEDPISYDINIKWNEPTQVNPDGKVNPWIEKWSTDTWESVDIWVDRYNNNDGGVLNYDNHEPGDSTKPVHNGDRPLVKHENMIYARIRNDGVMPVDDVYVTFYATSPPGIGDNGKWQTLGTDHIQTIPAKNEALAKYPWVPEANKHTCLRVEIMPRPDEMNPEDNCAQENVFDFDSPGGSSHRPVVVDAEVRSPFTIWRKVDMRVQGLPPGWHAVVNHGWVWTKPKGEKAVTAVIWTDLNAPYNFTPDEILLIYEDVWEVPEQALARVEGWTSFDHRYEPIGGLLANVKANKEVVIEYGFVADGSNLTGTGCLAPPLSGVPIMIEAVDSANQAYTFYLKTDSQGCFDLASLLQENPNSLQLSPGSYSVWVYVLPGGEAAETTAGPEQIVIV